MAEIKIIDKVTLTKEGLMVKGTKQGAHLRQAVGPHETEPEAPFQVGREGIARSIYGRMADIQQQDHPPGVRGRERIHRLVGIPVHDGHQRREGRQGGHDRPQIRKTHG